MSYTWGGGGNLMHFYVCVFGCFLGGFGIREQGVNPQGIAGINTGPGFE